MLEQATPLPALGTAHPLDACWVHQVCRCCTGKAVGLVSNGWFGTKLQRQPKAAEAIDQPLAGLSVSLLALPGRIRPDQGIGEPACMQHRAAPTGTPHQLKIA